MNSVLLYVIVVLFLATLIRSAFGFGEALVAVPLLALRIPVEVAAPLAVLMSITVAAVIVLQDWRKIHLRSASWLVLFSFLGIPLGLWLLTRADDRLMKAMLAVLVVAFASYSLFGRRRLELRDDHRLWLFGAGFLGGVLGGAYGMNGPPLVIYGSMRRWSPQHFRATLQGYFLPASLLGMAGYALAGLWVPAVTWYYCVSLPSALAAIVLGRVINDRLSGEAFLKYVYLGLIAIGALLLVQAFRG